MINKDSLGNKFIKFFYYHIEEGSASINLYRIIPLKSNSLITPNLVKLNTFKIAYIDSINKRNNTLNLYNIERSINYEIETFSINNDLIIILWLNNNIIISHDNIIKIYSENSDGRYNIIGSFSTSNLIKGIYKTESVISVLLDNNIIEVYDFNFRLINKIDFFENNSEIFITLSPSTNDLFISYKIKSKSINKSILCVLDIKREDVVLLKDSIENDLDIILFLP